MKRGLIFVFIIISVFFIFPSGFYPDPDEEDFFTDTGADGTGYNLVTKIRKDVLEGVFINAMQEEMDTISVGEIQLPDFTINGQTLALKINDMKVKIGVDYLMFDRDGGENSFNIGFHISEVSGLDVTNSFLMILPSTYANEEKKEILKTYFLNYFKNFGTVNVTAEIKTKYMYNGVSRLDGLEVKKVMINGWSFDEEGVLSSNGMPGIETYDENIYLFPKIGKKLAEKIFSKIEENEQLAEFFGIDFASVNCTALQKSEICQRSVLYEKSCLDENGAFDEKSSECMDYINECKLLPETCTGYFARYTYKILQNRSLLFNNQQDAFYSIADQVNVIKSKQPVYLKIKNSAGSVLKKGYFLQDNNLEYEEITSSTNMLTQEKLAPMNGSDLIETTISQGTLRKMLGIKIRQLFSEMEETKDLNIEEGPYFHIVHHEWADELTGETVDGNLGRVRIRLGGEMYGVSFEATASMYINAVIEESEKDGKITRKLNFQVVDKEISDIDVEYAWFWKLLAFFVGDVVSNAVAPTDHLLSGLISETVIQNIVSGVAISFGMDLLEGNTGDMNNLDGVDLDFLSTELLDNAFGKGYEYEYNSYFRRIINGNEKNSGLVVAIAFSNNNDALLKEKKKYINTFYYDDDSDGIKNIMDNCKNVYNPYQTDEDGDGVGSACDGGPRNGIILIPVKDKNAPLSSPVHDTDGDGVANLVDNCADEYNPFVETNSSSELISGICSGATIQENYNFVSCIDPVDGGAVFNPVVNKSVYAETGSCFNGSIYYWQPDADLDGIGDKCDRKDGLTVMGNRVPDLMAGYYSLDMAAGLKDFQNGRKTCSGFQNSICQIPVIKNRYVDVSVKMNTVPLNVDPDPESNKELLTQKFCWVDTLRIGFWGDDGFCTTTEGDGLRVITPEKKYLPVYGYSHGSDPAPADASGSPNWKDPYWKDDGVKTQKCKEGCVFTWDWRENLESEYYDLYDYYVVSVDEKGEEGSKDSFISYVFSSGVQSGTDQEYMTGEGASKKINPLHFKNSRTYARSKRDTFGGTDISYYRGINLELHPFYFGWSDIGSYLEKYGISPWWWMTGPGMPFEYENIDIYRYRDGAVSLIDKNISAAGTAGTIESVYVGKDNITGIFNLNDNANTKVLMTTRDKDSSWNVGAIVEMPRMSGTVNKVLELVPGQQFLMMDETAVYKFDSFYGTDDINQPMMRICNYRIQAEEIARLPFDGAFGEIVKLDGRVLIINKNASSVELYELDSVNGMVVPLSYDNAPSGRGHMNLEVIDSTLYLAGGAMINGTQILPLSDVYRFSFENGWETVTRDTGLNLMGAVIAKEGDSLKIYSRPFSNTGKINVAVIDENSGVTEIQSEIVEGGAVIEEKYCIDDSGINVYPGIETQHICQKIDSENYEYSGYTFLDYKMSLAGYENNLYIGGLTGVRRMEIRNDGSLKMKELVLAGHITSLAVSDDRLFGAAVDSIKVFKLESDGSVKFDRSVKASGCKDVRIRGNLLFAGMEGKVAVYDISNRGMVLIKNIPVDNNVEDLEISNGYLYVYHEKGFWFWKKNALTKFDIRNINTPVKTGNKSMECSDAEMMSDESHVYLGCENGQFRINKETPGLSVETVKGKKNYFRDSYVNDSIIYTVHSGRLFMSR